MAVAIIMWVLGVLFVLAICKTGKNADQDDKHYFQELKRRDNENGR